MEHALENKIPEPVNRFQNSNLAQAWLVLVLTVVFGAALAAVQVQLSSKIAQNKLNETLERIPALVWGEAAAREIVTGDPTVAIIPGTFSLQTDAGTDTYSLFKVTRHAKLAGWVLKSGGQGYADRIELLIGVDAQAKTITGLFVLEQKETPGLGNKITFPEWRRQFVNRPAGLALKVIKGGPPAGNTIDAVTGATISSRSVTGIVNRVMGAIAGKLTPETVRLSGRQT